MRLIASSRIVLNCCAPSAADAGLDHSSLLFDLRSDCSWLWLADTFCAGANPNNVKSFSSACVIWLPGARHCGTCAPFLTITSWKVKSIKSRGEYNVLRWQRPSIKRNNLLRVTAVMVGLRPSPTDVRSFTIACTALGSGFQRRRLSQVWMQCFSPFAPVRKESDDSDDSESLFVAPSKPRLYNLHFPFDGCG